MTDRTARLSAVSTNFQVAVRRAQELERSGACSVGTRIWVATLAHSINV